MWVDEYLSELLTHRDTGPMIRLAARLAAHGLKNGFENVDIFIAKQKYDILGGP